MDSTILTATDLSLSQSSMRKIEPHIIPYKRQQGLTSRPNLHTELRQKYAPFPEFQQLFIAADEFRQHLGTWCDDQFWSFAFADAAVKKREARLQRQALKRGANASIDYSDAEVARLFEAQAFVQAHRSATLTSPDMQLSPRVRALFDILAEHFERPTDHKCLIFVERKATARLLHVVAQQIGGPNLRSGIVTGTGSSSLEPVGYSHKEQAVTMMNFRNSDVNCLVCLPSPGCEVE